MGARAENYALKMKLDQEKSKKGDQKVTKKEPRLIVEMLKFDLEEKQEEVKEKEQPFILKEVVLGKQSQPEREMVTPPPPIDDVTTEDKENSSSASVLGQVKGEKPKKKSAMFADTVEVRDTDTGLVETNNLKEEPQDKVKVRARPQGRKQGGKAVIAKEAPECKQQ